MRPVVRAFAALCLAVGALGFASPPPVAEAAQAQAIAGESVTGPGGSTLTSGTYYTCAVKSDGTLACWGQSTQGGATPPSGQFRWVAARYDTTCAMQTHGGLTCWGWNGDGQLTLPTGVSFTEVSPGGTFICGIKTDGTLACWGSSGYSLTTPPSGTYSALSSAYDSACAITTGGSLACWGHNDNGQTSAPSTGTYTAVSDGGAHSCAITTNGDVVCWGLNTYGEAPVFRAGPYKAVSAGLFHTCAIRIDGTLECWGVSTLNRLAAPTGTFTEVSAGYFHTCARATNGTVSCWGDTSHNQTSVPSGLHVAAGVVPAVDAGGMHTCMVGANGAISCWGDNAKGELTAPVATFSQVSAGFEFTCGLKNDGTIACWGADVYGQVSNVPTGQFIEVAAGFAHACALAGDGTVTCWGMNNYGQATAPSGRYRSIAAGNFHTCGIRYNGTISCWGGNSYNNQSVPPAGTFVALSAGSWHSCAVRTDASIACWGYNADNQSVPPPTGTYVSVAAGTFNSCAINVTRAIVCWGGNTYGESEPFSGSWQSLTLYAGHGCSVTISTSSVICWGQNDVGQTIPFINTTTPPEGVDGQAYSFQLKITSGWTPAPWFTAMSALPPGLSVASNGTISGTPTAAGHFTFEVGTTNGIGPNLIATIALDVVPSAVRYSGADRFKTAVQISQHTWPTGASNVYIANAWNFPDALAGAAAAGSSHGPVLLTDSASLNADTAAEITRLAPTHIWVLGGTAAVSDAVYNALGGFGAAVTRLSGSDRFKTAVEISKRFWASGATTVYIANAWNFPDALAGAAAAGTVKGPVLLTDAASLNADTSAEISRLHPTKIIVLGGASAVSSTVYGLLGSFGATLARYSGGDRFATAVDISSHTFSPGVPVVYIANAYNFPDALAGAAAAGQVKGPVLLVSATGAIDPSTAAELTRLKPHLIVVLGGTAAVSDSVFQALKAYAVPLI